MEGLLGKCLGTLRRGMGDLWAAGGWPSGLEDELCKRKDCGEKKLTFSP